MKMIRESVVAKVLLVFLGGAFVSQGNATEIPIVYRVVAKENGVPSKLFFAMISRESQTSVDGMQRSLPWPWAVNDRGRGSFFRTRREAHDYLVLLEESGVNNFDIGLGQINWKWHSQKFENLWDALDPYKNLDVAAKYLRQQYERPECNDWWLAVGCYHRPAQGALDKKIAQRYREEVFRIWQKI